MFFIFCLTCQDGSGRLMASGMTKYIHDTCIYICIQYKSVCILNNLKYLNYISSQCILPYLTPPLGTLHNFVSLHISGCGAPLDLDHFSLGWPQSMTVALAPTIRVKMSNDVKPPNNGCVCSGFSTVGFH